MKPIIEYVLCKTTSSINEYLLSKKSKTINSSAFDAFKDKLADEAMIDSFERMPAEYREVLVEFIDDLTTNKKFKLRFGETTYFDEHTQVIDMQVSKDYWLSVTVANIPKTKCICIMFYMYSLGDHDAADEILVFLNDIADVEDCIKFCNNRMRFDDNAAILRVDVEDKSKVEEFKKKIYFVLR